MYTPRKSPHPAQLAVLAAITLFFAFLAIRFLGDSDTGPKGLVFGLSCAGMAVLIPAFVANAIAEGRFPRGLPAPRTAQWHGQGVTLLPHWQWGPRLLVATLGLFAAVAFAWALLDVLDPGASGIAWVLFPAAAFLSSPLVFGLLGRWRVGGLWLTRDGLVDHQASVRTEARWDELGRVAAGGPIVFLGIPRDRMRHLVPWLRERVRGEDSAYVEAATLGVRPEALAEALRHWATHPADRDEIGTEAALRRLLGAGGRDLHP